MDDGTVGLLATEHLIQVGCKRIAHIRGPEDSPGMRRLTGYKQALRNHDRSENPDYIVAERTVDVESRERGRGAMSRLLALTPIPDGVFCYNDPLAIGAIERILEFGLRVPADIAVIGCGDLHYDSALRVALSSVNQHTAQIGERAAKLVLKLIDAKTPPQPIRIILQPEVVARLSTQRRRQSKKR